MRRLFVGELDRLDRWACLILSRWIISNRGLLVYERPKLELKMGNQEESFLQEAQVGLKAFSEDFTDDQIWTWEGDVPNTSCIGLNKKGDTFVLWIDLSLRNIPNPDDYKKDFENLAAIRKDQRRVFKGIMFIDFLDEVGPDVRFNTTDLHDDDALRIGMQCFSTLGFGASHIDEGFQGPLFMAEYDLAVLIYGFVRPAPESKDVRMARMGRPGVLIVLFPGQGKNYAQDRVIRNFIETLFERAELSKHADLPEQFLSNLMEEVQDMVSFALDINQVERDRVTRMQERLIELEREIQELKVENEQLREKHGKTKKRPWWAFWRKG